MNFLDRAIQGVSPGWAVRRAKARQSLTMLEGYNALRAPSARLVSRGSPDADAFGRQREGLAWISRDLIRNTPLARRAQAVIVANVVGDGIIPKVVSRDERTRKEMLEAIKAHFDTTAIDADGRQNLYGLQALALSTVVDAGEVLVRRRRRYATDGFRLPFQIQLLEPEYLDDAHDQDAAAPRDGQPGRNRIHEGIEYDAIGHRVAYWLFDQHPGAAGAWRGGLTSRRVAASDVIHLYAQDRPGQMRGVTWLAPVLQTLRDYADYSDAQLVRQQIAACFTAFRTTMEGPEEDETFGGLERLSPGLIRTLPPGEDIKFAEPPGVAGYDEFTRGVLRMVAAGLGITYESLSGDLSNVNFSSGRMGRMEMDRNISAWQWRLLIPQMMHPLTAWTMEAWALASSRVRPASLDWVPPARIVVDPAKEYGAMGTLIRNGLTSRSAVVRSLGYDAETVEAEIAEDNARADERGFIFDTDPRRTAAAGNAQPSDEPEPQEAPDAEE